MKVGNVYELKIEPGTAWTYQLGTLPIRIVAANAGEAVAKYMESGSGGEVILVERTLTGVSYSA